ncbi:HNH endonuclease [Halorubrum sp. Atlit-26R]|uniref:HNH endonuclease n=1 Tax=Halorubrum sp. Atlit-26R TaxID=2282128 RepID=UPI000EF1AE64|nr:HNH endonuclease [Halorubrum sp. Atlit-26R]RLM62589.1 HNH endonuclease [Halorubrum sp. Atlit-26R]
MTSTETPWRDESLLQKLYWEQHLSTNEIADEWDCDQATVWKWMDRFDIPRRSAYEAATNRRLHPAVFTDRGYVICASNHRGTTDSVGIHRLVMVAEHGFDAVAGKHVHHRNGIRFDNRPRNLELLSRGEHAQRHGFGTDIRPPSEELAYSNQERDDQGRFKLLC